MLNYLKAWFGQFQKDERGVTIVEYALMLVFVAIAVAAAMPSIRDAVVGVFTTVVGYLTPA